VAGVPNAGALEHSPGGHLGRTTTVIDFAAVPDAGDLAQGIHDYLPPWRGQAYTDYSTHRIYSTNAAKLLGLYPREGPSPSAATLLSPSSIGRS